ncbi:MAG: calcium/sodium antiporter [Burkholderiaceae bacterium]|nr:calcium/sodium antiporter [Burkholderiaceae bacterium]
MGSQLMLFLLGLAALIGGAEVLVRGASRIATAFGLSPLMVGLTVVAFGTSAPELAVATGAALSGQTAMALGNVVGSNILNVLMILGAAALIAPLRVDRQLIRQEVPIMIGASLLMLVLALDGRISRADAALLTLGLAWYTIFLVRRARLERNEPRGDDSSTVARTGVGARLLDLAMVLAGLALLANGADWLVEAASAFARSFGISDLVIGLTVVALGTSAPELAASIVAALRGERDMAVGNVIGSNLFNILGCIGIAGLLAPSGLPAPASLLSFDLWVMIAVAVACLPIFFTGREVARWEGALFLAYAAAYVGYVLLAATHHDALPWFSNAMLSFVLPLTVVTLVVSVVAPGQARGD